MSSNSHQWIDSTPPTLKPMRLGRFFDVGQRSGNGAQTPPRAPKPKRQRIRPPPGEAQRNQTFYFVDSNNASSREKRAHVMRHHIEKKRERQKASHGSINGNSDRTIGDPSWRMKSEPEGDYEPSALERDQSESSAGGSSSRIDLIEEAVVGPQPETALSRRSPDAALDSPVTILDASRKDPFKTLPMINNRDDLELVDYWVNRLSYWSGQNPHLKNEVFRTAMNHPLSFQSTILAYCARWKTQIYDLTESKELQRHMGQVKKGLEEARQGAVEIDQDSLALAFSGLAMQEERFGEAEIAVSHADRAIQILRPRIGSKTTAEVFLHYARYMIIPPRPAIDAEGRQWLVTFLRGAQELMTEHGTESYLSLVPERRTAFHMGSPLFPLVSTGPHPSRVPQHSHMYVLQNAPTQNVSRGAALIYITAVLWDLRDSPSKTRRFLEYLFGIVREHRLDRDPACETLVWALLEEKCDPDLRDSERAWSTGELLNVSKQLPPRLQFQFNEMLMGFLLLMPGIPDVNAFEGELEDMKEAQASNYLLDW